MQQTLLSPAEAGERADLLYRTRIRPLIAENDRKKFLEIEVFSGDYEIDADEDAVHDRLAARHPNGYYVLMRADGGTAGHFGFSMR